MKFFSRTFGVIFIFEALKTTHMENEPRKLKRKRRKNRWRFCFLMFSVFSAPSAGRLFSDFIPSSLSRRPFSLLNLHIISCICSFNSWMEQSKAYFWGQFRRFLQVALLNAIFNFSVPGRRGKNKEKFSQNENEIQNNGTLKSGAKPNGEPRRRKRKSEPTMQ